MSREDALTRSVTAVRGLFDAAACSCALASADGSALVFVAADGAGAAQILGVELPVGRGLAGWAAMSGQPVSITDVGDDDRFARDVAEATHYLPTTILAAPFFDAEGEVLGVLEVLDPAVSITGDWPLAVLGTLAAQLAAVVTATDTAGPDHDLAELGRRVLALVEDRGR